MIDSINEDITIAIDNYIPYIQEGGEKVKYIKYKTATKNRTSRDGQYLR